MKQIYLSLLILSPFAKLFAQENIGIGTQTPHASAILDASSTTKGMLAPRMTTAQRSAIAAPAKGLLVYDTDANSLYHYNGSVWANLAGGGGFSLPYTASVNLNTHAFSITNAGNGAAISGITTNEFGYAVSGISNSAYGYGIFGYANAPDAVAIYGNSGDGTAVKGYSVGGLGMDARSTNNSAIKASIILGANVNPTIIATHAGGAPAIEGNSQTGYGIRGVTSTTSSSGAALYGLNSGTQGNGVLGVANFATGTGVQGTSTTGTGVFGYSNSNRGVAGSTISGTALYGNSITGYGLEVAGKVKISGGNTNPSNGAVLTSDASGNAVWKPNRIGFHAGGVNTNYGSVPHNSWRRVYFHTGDFYDLSNSYSILTTNPQTNSGTFTAPVAGIYHFDVAVRLSVFKLSDAPFVTYGDLVLKKNSGGTISNLFWKGGGIIYNDDNISSIHMDLSKDVFLQAGDRVYIEVRQLNNDQMALTMGGVEDTYFNGHLIIPQ